MFSCATIPGLGCGSPRVGGGYGNRRAETLRIALEFKDSALGGAEEPDEALLRGRQGAMGAL